MTWRTEVSRSQGYVSMSAEARIKFAEVAGEQFCVAVV